MSEARGTAKLTLFPLKSSSSSSSFSSSAVFLEFGECNQREVRLYGITKTADNENDDEDEDDLRLEDHPHPAKLFVTFVQKGIDRFLFQLIKMRQERRAQILRG